MADDLLAINGVDGESGSYLLPDLRLQDASRIAQGETIDPEHFQELKLRHEGAGAHFGLEEGRSTIDLAQAGWGVIFAHSEKDNLEETKAALKELLDYRKEQAGELYQEFSGPKAYRPGESKQAFLRRFDVGPGPVNPKAVPFYLLLVGSPEAIPYRFQYQLDVQFAVGRIHFDNVEDYAAYAKAVVSAEKGETLRDKRVDWFGVQNPDDRATKLSSEDLVDPLVDWIAKPEQDGWASTSLLREQATKSNLSGLLGGDERPALLFTASHGMGFKRDNPLQIPKQGALLCSDWPGPYQWRGKPIPEDFYFSGDDVTKDLAADGLISFFFACYGGGTPQKDDFAKRAFKERLDIAPHSFVAQLPQRLLANGALAAVGHVERAWGCSFHWPGAGRQITVFTSALKALFSGKRLGDAMEHFNDRYAEISSDLSEQLEELEHGADISDEEIAGLWTANNDARSYVIVGDPAVQLATKGRATE